MPRLPFSATPTLPRVAGAAALAAATAIALFAAGRAGAVPSGAGPAGPDGLGRTAVSGPMTHPDQDHAGWSLRLQRGAVAGAAPVAAAAVTQTRGMDVSGWQGNVAWSTAWSKGARFAYVKATENTTYRNPYFAQQYDGSYGVGMIRGAYHFALPDRSSGTAQADWFVSHGGGWSRDGRTLPPALDIEYNPYGATCYGLTAAAMVSWVRAFSNEVHARTSRYPTIYSTRDWWVRCTGNSAAFAATNPLWIACYCSTAGTLPAGWGFHTFWQFASTGALPGDQDVFNGAYARLQALANG